MGLKDGFWAGLVGEFKNKIQLVAQAYRAQAA